MFVPTSMKQGNLFSIFWLYIMTQKVIKSNKDQLPCPPPPPFLPPPLNSWNNDNINAILLKINAFNAFSLIMRTINGPINAILPIKPVINMPINFFIFLSPLPRPATVKQKFKSITSAHQREQWNSRLKIFTRKLHVKGPFASELIKQTVPSPLLGKVEINFNERFYR